MDMINPIWIWVLGMIGGLVVGAFIGFVINAIYKWIVGRKLKKNIPTTLDDRNFANPGKAHSMSIKEVEENERIKFDKFREFEKLRRLAKPNTTVGGEAGLYTRSIGESQRSSIQDKASSSAGEHSKSVRLD